MVDFDIGQRVILKKNLGSRKKYSFGDTIDSFPLGAKGTIVSIRYDTMIRVELDNKRSSYFNPGEISLLELSDREIKKKEEEKEKKLGKKLESLICDDIPFVEEDPTTEKPFEPKFNVREEFVIWMNEQFPNLETSIFTDGDKYEDFQRRKKEVCAAAVLACEHGIRTTESCVSMAFMDNLSYLKPAHPRLENGVLYLIDLITQFSANINSQGHHHYGTRLITGDKNG